MKKHHLNNIGYLNLHFSLHEFAINIGNVFVGVYLYQIGLPLWQIFLVWGLTFAARFLVRPISIKLCMKAGLKKVIIFGSLFYSILYLTLGKVQGIDLWLLTFILLVGLTDVFYWLPYHTYYSIIGNEKSRGKETGIRDGLVNIARFLSPVVGGVLINVYGYLTAFIATMLIALIATVPLFFTPVVKIKTMSLKNALKKIEKKGFWLYMGDGFLSHNNFIWHLILFLLVLNYVSFGGLIGIAVFLQATAIFMIGKLFDKRKRVNLYQYGLIITALVILGRSFFVYTIPAVIMMDLVYMAGMALYSPTLNAAYYNTAKQSEHILWFQFFSEAGWDFGVILASAISAFILYMGFDLRIALPFTILGTLAINGFLKEYFKNTPEKGREEVAINS